jgi:hypothetical protein
MYNNQQYNLLSLSFVSVPQMALPLRHLPALLHLLMLISRATVDGNFTVSKAVYYPNSDTRGTESK